MQPLMYSHTIHCHGQFKVTFPIATGTFAVDVFLEAEQEGSFRDNLKMQSISTRNLEHKVLAPFYQCQYVLVVYHLLMVKIH